MKNTIFKKLVFLSKISLASLLVLIFSLSGFLSCASMPQAVIDDAFPRVDSSPPVDAFGLVMTRTKITPDKCLDNKNIETCKKVIQNLPEIENSGVGSGILIKAKTMTVFLTAAHVCESDTKRIYDDSGIKFTLKSQTTVKVRISSGEEIDGKILKLDDKTDLCALELSRNYTRPIIWSPIEPVVGDKVYAISAPHGINAPTMNLIFSGFYSGFIGKLHHYTIPTRPGSSGSVVLDKNFRGVGMLNAAYISMESLGLGTGYKDIKMFLDSI